MEIEQFNKFLSRLPENIENKILYEHIIPYLILIKLNMILNSNDSKKLNYRMLYCYLKYNVLSNKIVVKNLISNDNIFKTIYEKHIIRGEKTFVMIKDQIESMALSWLHYLYH